MNEAQATTPDGVAQFLVDHPQFLDQFFALHPELVARVVVPHPHSGRAVSITERQMLALREKNKSLEGNLGELLRFGEQNDAISEKMHRVGVALVAAATFQAVVHLLEFHLREDFLVPHVALRLWNLPPGVGELPEFAARGEELEAFADTLTRPYCGTSAGFETATWFGEFSPHIRSQALIALRNGGGTLGLLALGSEDVERFYPDMGTLYLERLGELTSAALGRVLREEGGAGGQESATVHGLRAVAASRPEAPDVDPGL